MEQVVTTDAERASTGTYTVLYEFQGTPDGSDPQGVTVDKAGNVFGTTSRGGSPGDGSLFELTGSGSTYSEKIVHSFDYNKDGRNPQGEPFEDRQGTLYVSTLGSASSCGSVAQLKKVESGYEETALAQFKTCSVVEPPLKLGKTVYVAIYSSYTYGGGALVALSPHHLQPSVLYTFPGDNGQSPNSRLAADSAGSLYGTANYVLFKFVPAAGGGIETTLWTFSPGDGENLLGGVVLDKNGNFYGTAQSGGRYGFGLVYKISRSGSGYTETILHEFLDGADGANPASGVVLKGDTLYGVTEYGGTNTCVGGCGTLFKVSTSGSHYKVVHTFLGNDGAFPSGALAVRGDAIYGATSQGGTYGGGSEGNGVVFRYVP